MIWPDLSVERFWSVQHSDWNHVLWWDKRWFTCVKHGSSCFKCCCCYSITCVCAGISECVLNHLWILPSHETFLDPVRTGWPEKLQGRKDRERRRQRREETRTNRERETFKKSFSCSSLRSCSCYVSDKQLLEAAGALTVSQEGRASSTWLIWME